jgi:hypothetical protein
MRKGIVVRQMSVNRQLVEIMMNSTATMESKSASMVMIPWEKTLLIDWMSLIVLVVLVPMGVLSK